MPTIAGFLAIIMWGMLAVFSVYTKSVPPFLLLFICFSIAALITVIKRLVLGQSVFMAPKLTRSQWGAGIVGLFGFHFCYFMAIRHAPAIEVSLIGYLWPLLLGIYVARESNRSFAIAGGILGFVGSALLITDGGTVSLNQSHILGYFLAFICALIWSSYSWFLSKSQSNVEDIAWIAGVVAVLSLLSHFLFETGDFEISTLSWLNLVLLGIGPVGGAFYLWDIGMKQGNRQLLASVSFFTPVISSLALYFFGFAQLSASVVISVAMILLGALVSNSAAVWWQKLKLSFAG